MEKLKMQIIFFYKKLLVTLYFDGPFNTIISIYISNLIRLLVEYLVGLRLEYVDVLAKLLIVRICWDTITINS